MSLLNFLSDNLPKAAGNVLDSNSQKYVEAGGAVASIYNGVGNFVRLAAAAPTIATNAANQLFDRARVAASSAIPQVPSNIDEHLRQVSESPHPPTRADELMADVMRVNQEEQTVTASQQKQVNRKEGSDDSHKVKLIERGVSGKSVIFDVMPEVVESRTVEYGAVAPPQYPTAFQKYKGTSSTQWTVNATLISRTTDEATRNLGILNILRGWTMPFFGTNTAKTFPNKLGAPPPVLTFSGWRERMVGPVQVVITSLNWNFPQDVDYIPARRPEDGVNSVADIPFPTVIKLAIQLIESFSTDQVNGFNLDRFRYGDFEKAFTSLPKSVINQAAAQANTEQESQQVSSAYRREGNNYPKPVSAPKVVSQPLAIVTYGYQHLPIGANATIGNVQDYTNESDLSLGGGN